MCMCATPLTTRVLGDKRSGTAQGMWDERPHRSDADQFASPQTHLVNLSESTRPNLVGDPPPL